MLGPTRPVAVWRRILDGVILPVAGADGVAVELDHRSSVRNIPYGLAAGGGDRVGKGVGGGGEGCGGLVQ